MSDDQTRRPEELFAGLPEDRAAARGLEDTQQQAAECREPAEAPLEAELAPRLTGRRRGRRGGKRLVLPKEPGSRNFSPQERLLILDTWRRSGLPAGDFAALVDLSKHTLYAWKKAFDQQGPAGLMDQPRGAKTGSHLPELTKRAILMQRQGAHGGRRARALGGARGDAAGIAALPAAIQWQL